ncbi:MAG: helix-turn-helix domain-containing protein [Sulfuricaulis sp.]|nr:helix-turn-helix domain-containing protein [Sulfuricaulis sp.]
METLKAWREAEHLSVPEAAARVGVERATWWRWEAGVRPVGLESLQRVAIVTGIPASDLRPDVAAKMAGAA